MNPLSSIQRIKDWLSKPSPSQALLDEFDKMAADFYRQKQEEAIERDRMRYKTCSLVDCGCGLNEMRGEGR